MKRSLHVIALHIIFLNLWGYSLSDNLSFNPVSLQPTLNPDGSANNNVLAASLPVGTQGIVLVPVGLSQDPRLAYLATFMDAQGDSRGLTRLTSYKVNQPGLSLNVPPGTVQLAFEGVDPDLNQLVMLSGVQIFVEPNPSPFPNGLPYDQISFGPTPSLSVSTSTRILSASAPPQEAPWYKTMTVSPIFRVTALGGQYFTTSVNSEGANVDVSFAPAIGISPTLSLTPIYLGSYHETQSPYNFQGQNVLIQRQVDQMGVLYLTWAPSSVWRLKPRVGYKKEWAKQNIDDDLGSGLLNYNRFFLGASAEARLPSDRSFEIGYEFSTNIYPNYKALTSDPRLVATGITSEAGTNVLDFNAHDTSLDYEFSSPSQRWHFSNSFHWIRQYFVDQTVLLDLGAFDTARRTDDVFLLSFQQSFTFQKFRRYWQPALGETVQYYISNQNAFDANQLFFTQAYYNFVDIQLNPSLTLPVIPGRLEVVWLINLGLRQYNHRHIQDGSGAYQDPLIYSFNRSLGGIVRYRIAKSLYAVLVRNLVTYSSNTNFEQNYPYNYTVFDILGGLSWEYGY